MKKITIPVATLLENLYEAIKGLVKKSCDKVPRFSCPILTAGTTFDVGKLVFDGKVLTRYILECADTTNNVTRTLSIIDVNGITIWSGATHADNANYTIPIDVELDGTYTFRLTLSGAAGNDVIDYLTLYVR